MRWLVLILLSCLGSCAPLKTLGHSARFDAVEASIASHFVDRGVVQIDRPVGQVRLVGVVPDPWGNDWVGGARILEGFEDDAGDGLLVNGSSGPPGRADYRFAVRRELGPGAAQLFVRGWTNRDPAPGVLGDDFTEMGFAYELPDAAIHPRFEFAYEADEVEDFYARLFVDHPILVEGNFDVELVGHVGLMGSSWARRYFLGENNGGFSDVVFGPRAHWRATNQTTFTLECLYHSAVEEAYRKRLTSADIPPDQLVLTLSCQWHHP